MAFTEEGADTAEAGEHKGFVAGLALLDGGRTRRSRSCLAR
jgi:hypothetical protein